MKNTDIDEFNCLLDVTWEIYPKPLSEGAKRLYWEILKQYPIEDIRSAISRHLQNPDTGQFPPKPADIIRMVSGGTQTASALAWTKTLRAIRTIGPYQSIVFDDPVIHAVIADMGGWMKICETTEDETPFVARDFERRYTGYVMRDKFQYPKTLTGIADFSNEGKTFERGSALPQLVVFGDQDKGRLVYKKGSERQIGFQRMLVALPGGKSS